jgi:hypothetical protein
MRDDNGNPRFGINPWPEERYGEFYSGDSYIVLETTKNEDSDKFNYDIYFWIGKDSTQVSLYVILLFFIFTYKIIINILILKTLC